MPKKNNMVPVVFKADVKLVRAAKAKARKDSRTLSAYIRILIERDVKSEAA